VRLSGALSVEARLNSNLIISSLYDDIQDEATLEEIFPPDTTVGNYRQIERKLKHLRRLKEEYDILGASLEGKLKQHGKGCPLSSH
jgi:hypothetical protein